MKQRRSNGNCNHFGRPTAQVRMENWNGASSTIFLSLGENITSADYKWQNSKGLDTDIGTLVTYDVGGTDATYFSIDSNGRLYLAAKLDYESATILQKITAWW